MTRPSGRAKGIAGTLLASLVLSAAACSINRGDPGPAVRIGPGEWSVGASDDTLAVLVRHPRAAAQGGRGAENPAEGALVYHASGRIGSTTLDSVVLRTPGSPPGPSSAFGLAQLDGPRIVALPGRSPALVRSRAQTGFQLFELADGIWAVDPASAPRRLTSTTHGIFAYDDLRLRQREGEVILYWATAPVWSPSGRLVAYVTNREAVRAGRRGQSIWSLDLESGLEKPLLQEDDRSFRPVGWLGDEILYIGDFPGVWALEAATGGRRELSHLGTLLDWASDGSAIALAYGAPEATRIEITTLRDRAFETFEIPAPAVGFLWDTDAAFSPDGRRLLLSASANAGAVREYHLLDVAAGRVRALTLPEGRPSTRPTWLTNDALLVHVVPAAGAEAEAWAVPLGPTPPDGRRGATPLGATDDPARVAGTILPAQPPSPEPREQMQALIGGTLVRDGQCLRVRSEGDGAHHLLIWPPGYTFAEEATTVLDENGRPLYRLGDTIRVSGGEVTRLAPTALAPGITAARLERLCRGPYWIVGGPV